jgi:hypothetical protein
VEYYAKGYIQLTMSVNVVLRLHIYAATATAADAAAGSLQALLYL